MLRKRNILLITAVLLIALAAWVSAATHLVDQRSVLSGKVVAKSLAVPGTSVREGDVLVVVDSITGPVPAVRSTADGIVREVLVSAGDAVQAGEVLVRLEPVTK